MNKQLRLLTLLCLVSWRCGVSAAVFCSPGERLHTPRHAQAGDECIPCGSGTFMPKRNHMLRECYNCSKIENTQIETVITECSRTHDTEIGCISGYYRLKAKTVLDKDSCVECGKCESGFPARPCQGYNDTVCCPLHQDAVLNSQGIIECWERPTCEAGMYYNTTLQRCMSCPNGTYMQARGHTNRACIKCETLSGNTSNHAAILHSCSRTSPTIFGCEEGHFRVSNKASMLEEVPCRLCKKCRFEVKKCHSHQDADCASERPEDDYDDFLLEGKGIGQVEDAIMKPSVNQFKFSLFKCSEDCLFETGDSNIDSALLRTVLYIILSIFFIFTGCSLSKNLATCYFGKICLHRGQFIRVLIILNAFNSCLFIFKVHLQIVSRNNDNNIYFLIITTAVCYILLTINFPLVWIFVTNAKPKSLLRRNASKDEETPHNEDIEETQQVFAPPAKDKEISAIIKPQHDISDDT